MWSVEDLIEDARLLGNVISVFEGRRLRRISSEYNQVPVRPIDRDEEISAFLGSIYTQVLLARSVDVYRFYDDARAGVLGSWWSTTRPGIAIDDLRLPAIHNTARDDYALKQEWNAMVSVARAELLVGAWVYFGRIAPVVDEKRKYPGGHLQILVPDAQRGKIHLAQRYDAL